MKILHVITGLDTGGAERALYNLLEGGLGRSAENRVISLSGDGFYGPKIRALNIPVDTVGMLTSRPSAKDIICLRRLARASAPNIIQGWMYHGNLAATLVARLLIEACPVAWNVRHTLYDLQREKRGTQLVIRANRFLSKMPARILYNSHLARLQHKEFGFFEQKAQVIPNGFDLNRFRPDERARESFRAELALPKDAVLVGHLARFHPMKNHRGFLAAVDALTKSREEVHVLLGGRGVDMLNPELQPLLRKLPQGRLHLVGQRHDVEKIMPALDVFCMSSAWGEAFPNVIGEAMACGVPCVATDVGDSEKIIGETGVVVPAGDCDSLKSGIEKLVSLAASERAVLGRAARRRIEENYSIECSVAQYRELYKQLSGSD